MRAGRKEHNLDRLTNSSKGQPSSNAPTRVAAEAAIDVFADQYDAKYDKAVVCLTKDRDALLAFMTSRIRAVRQSHHPKL